MSDLREDGQGFDAQQLPDLGKLIAARRAGGGSGGSDGGFRGAEDDEELFFASIEEVQVAAFIAAQRPVEDKKLRRIATWLVNQGDDITGRREEWHNLVNVYFNVGDYYDAMRIARRALEIWPFELTLLADCIQCSMNIGDWEYGKVCVEKARRIPFGQWDWYALVQLSEFYKAMAMAHDDTQREAYIREAIAVTKEYLKVHPDDERVFNQEAELYLELGEVDEARRVLEQAIYGSVEGLDGNACSINAAQCCITYLQEILDQRADYDKIVEIARLGLQYAAQERESVHMGYFLYREALALDGKIHACDRVNHNNGFGNTQSVRDVLAAYQLAYKLNEGRSTFRAIIRSRFEILKSKAGIDDMELSEN